MIHNYYLQRGGEDECFEAESSLLSESGHEVISYVRHSRELLELPKFRMAQKTIWNHHSYRQVSDLIARHHPDIVHTGNLFPLISPAVYHAANQANLAIVSPLQNYRLFCPSALLHRNGKRCTECRNRLFAWPGIRYKCYRDSSLATSVVATKQAVHRWLGSWSMVDRFYAVSEATRKEHIAAGLDPERILVKPNFLKTPPPPGTGSGGYAVFAGRLTEEKGVRLLLDAWAAPMPIPLKIIGDGPLRDEVAQAGNGVEYLGSGSLDDVLELMREAKMTLVPSLWPEPFGRVVAESYACGTPVLAAPFGALESIVRPGVTGYHFTPDVEAVREAVAKILALSPYQEGGMRERARQEFESKYTGARNLEFLLQLYREAQAHRLQRSNK